MTNQPLISQCLTAPALVIGVVGSHAGENLTQIFKRKMTDIAEIGITFWVIQSTKAKPPVIHDLLRQTDPSCVAFVTPASPGGAQPTKTDTQATKYSANRLQWKPLPDQLSPVTGKINKASHALVLDALELTTSDMMIDLWNFADFAERDKPLIISRGRSTVCVYRKDMSAHPDRLKSRWRKIIAVGRLSNLGGVWLQ